MSKIETSRTLSPLCISSLIACSYLFSPVLWLKLAKNSSGPSPIVLMVKMLLCSLGWFRTLACISVVAVLDSTGEVIEVGKGRLPKKNNYFHGILHGRGGYPHPSK